MVAKHVMVIADAVFPLAVSRGTTRGERDRFFEEIDSYVSRKMITSGALTPVTGDAGLSDHSAFAGRLLDILEENQESYITSKQLFDKLARAMVGAEGQTPEWAPSPTPAMKGPANSPSSCGPSLWHQGSKARRPIEPRHSRRAWRRSRGARRGRRRNGPCGTAPCRPRR